MTDPRQDEVGVTQADRQAAADAIADWQTIPFFFKDDLAKAFAAHRRRAVIASMDPVRQVAMELRELIDRLADAERQANYLQFSKYHGGRR